MALTFTAHVGDGATTSFPFAFEGPDIGYFREEDIFVEVEGVEATYTLTGSNQITLTEAPAIGASIRIKRVMPIDAPYTSFVRGNNFGQDNMNRSFEQQLYLLHETMDGFKQDGYYEKQDLSLGTVFKIKDLAPGTLSTDAATVGQLNTANTDAETSADEAAASAAAALISEENAANSATFANASKLAADASAAAAAASASIVLEADEAIAYNTAHRLTVGSSPHLPNVPNVNCTNASNITSGTLPNSVLPALAITNTFVVATQIAQLALVAQEGDVAVRTDLKKSYIRLNTSLGTMSDWQELLTPTDTVTSVNGATGTVVLTQDTVGDGATYKRSHADYTVASKTKLDYMTVSSLVNVNNLGRGVNVKDYGALGNGVANDTAAILSAITALPTSGGIVFFPAGVYNIASGITIIRNAVTLMGEGPKATVIQGTFAAGSIITIGSLASNVDQGKVTGMTITSSVAKTSGAGIKVIGAHQIYLDHIRLDSHMHFGVQFEGGTFGSGQFLYYMDHFEINSGVHGIIVGDDGLLVADTWIGTGIIAGTTDAGIMLKHCSGTYLRDIDIISCNGGLLAYPPSGKQVVALFANAVLCDTCKRSGWMLNGTAGGTIGDWNLTGCWGATNVENGILFDNSNNAGKVSGIALSAFRAINNTQHGIKLTNYVSKITLVNCQSMFNSPGSNGTYHGMYVSAGASNWSVIGGVFGYGGAFADNPQGLGIYIAAGTSSKFVIIGVNLEGNYLGSLFDGSTGGYREITNNPGYTTEATGINAIAKGTKAFTVTHGLGRIPLGSEIRLQALVSPIDSGGGYIWPSAITATQFTLNCANTTISDYWIGWSIKLGK